VQQSSRDRAIVIGAGVGGLSLAIYLAQHDVDVEVFEQRDQPGGRCGTIARDGHRFDLGATLLLLPRLIESVFADWDEDPASLGLRPLDPIYTLYFERGARFRFTPDLDALRAEIERFEPGAFPAWERYHALGCRQLDEAFRWFLGRNFDGPGSYFTPANAARFLRLRAHRRHFALVSRFFRAAELRAAFTFQNIYIGHSPYSASAVWGAIPAMELSQGASYPAGGMYGIVQRLVQLARARGVRIHLGVPVSEIVVRGRLDGLGHHGVFLGDDYARGFDAIFGAKGRRARPPLSHFYVNRPLATEAGAAPPGRDSVTVIVPAPACDGRQGDWRGVVDETRSMVLSRLAAEGWPLGGDRIALEICHAPPWWRRALNITRGAVFGSLAHDLDQLGWLRPANRHPRIRGLYFVGGSTQPGSGVPLVLLSGRLTAERVLADRGKTLSGRLPPS